DSVVQIFTIDKAAQSITFGALENRTFGTNPFLLTATSSSNLLVFYSASNTFVAINNNILTIRGAGTVSITAYQTGSNLYHSSSVQKILTIQKASHTIVFTQFPPMPIVKAEYTLQVSSNANSSEVAVNTTVFTSSDTFKVKVINGGRIQTKSSGTVTIIAYYPGTTNYDSAKTQIQMTIQKIDQQIRLDATISKIYGYKAAFILPSIESKIYGPNYMGQLHIADTSIVTKNKRSTDTLVLLIKKAGTTSLTRTFPGDDNVYNTAVFKQYVYIQKNQPTITFASISEKLEDAPPFKLVGSSTSSSDSTAAPITYTSDNISILTIRNDTASITKGSIGQQEVSVEITAKQAETKNYLEATWVKRQVIIKPSSGIPQFIKMGVIVNGTKIPTTSVYAHIDEEIILFAESNIQDVHDEILQKNNITFRVHPEAPLPPNIELILSKYPKENKATMKFNSTASSLINITSIIIQAYNDGKPELYKPASERIIVYVLPFYSINGTVSIAIEKNKNTVGFAGTIKLIKIYQNTVTEETTQTNSSGGFIFDKRAVNEVTTAKYILMAIPNNNDHFYTYYAPTNQTKNGTTLWKEATQINIKSDSLSTNRYNFTLIPNPKQNLIPSVENINIKWTLKNQLNDPKNRYLTNIPIVFRNKNTDEDLFYTLLNENTTVTIPIKKDEYIYSIEVPIIPMPNEKQELDLDRIIDGTEYTANVNPNVITITEKQPINSLTNTPQTQITEQIIVSPTPFKEHLSITFANGTHLKEIKIIDITGNIIFYAKSSHNNISIDTETWKHGVYGILINIPEENTFKNITILKE
ncbi:MAG: hypothetical protein QM536_05990, partial [Chitinophagaceae bacterium]|nr:hypothetical protein [Chitinophagaceae bacterium]